MTEVQKYVVTGKNYPEWLNNGARAGIVKTVLDEDGQFSHIVIETPTKRKFAYKNDVIIKTKSGFGVLTGEQAEKYRVMPKKVEKKSEGNTDEVEK